MSADENYVTYPDAPIQAKFTEAEWEKAERALDQLKQRLAAKCKHIIKGDPLPNKRWIRKQEIEKELAEVDERLEAAEREASGNY